MRKIIGISLLVIAVVLFIVIGVTLQCIRLISDKLFNLLWAIANKIIGGIINFTYEVDYE